ncbi:MAG: hypothetical protein CM15mV33_880 [uncultured marine virus]|nr:MAG: hypothetical protein CM15mV33_880 [uncultured marine virus]
MDIFALILGADDPFAVGSDTRNAFKLQIRTQTLGFVDDILDASEAARIRLVNQLTQKNIQGDLEELAANGFLSKETY